MLKVLIKYSRKRKQNYSYKKQISIPVGREGRKEGLQRGDEYVHYLNHGDVFMVV